MKKLLVVVSLIFFDLFAIANLEGHGAQWVFFAISVLAAIALSFDRLSFANGAKQFHLNGARAWMLIPLVAFVLKLLSNFVYCKLSGDLSDSTQDYVSISGAFCFSMVFLGLAIGSSLRIDVRSPKAMVVVFFGLLFIVFFLFFLFGLALAFGDDSWLDFQF